MPIYISCHQNCVSPENEAAFIASAQASHAGLRSAAGFRWAMLLRSSADATRYVALEMWLSRQQANAATPETSSADEQSYEVATARGSMTPCKFAAFARWSIDEADKVAFVNQWNSEFHHLEDRMGSRLLQDLGASSQLSGLHVSNGSALDPKELAMDFKDATGLTVRPQTVELLEVVALTEA